MASNTVKIDVHSPDGSKSGSVELPAELFDVDANIALMHQVVTAQLAAARQGTHATKTRAMVSGGGRKPYRQKGTGRARRGPIRTPVLRGGGHTFAKYPHSFRSSLPKKMRRAALKTAILAKILGQDLMILDGLSINAPQTREMVRIVGNLNIDRSCLLALAEPDENIYLSSRNIPALTVRVAGELNAFDVATRRKMLITTEAMKKLISGGGEQ